MIIVKQATCSKNVLELLKQSNLKFTEISNLAGVTQSSMVEWLYTEYNIWVSVRRVKSTNKYRAGWRYEVDIPTQPLIRQSLKSYNTKEVAYDEAFSLVIKYYLP